MPGRHDGWLNQSRVLAKKNTLGGDTQNDHDSHRRPRCRVCGRDDRQTDLVLVGQTNAEAVCSDHATDEQWELACTMPGVAVRLLQPRPPETTVAMHNEDSVRTEDGKNKC